MVVVLVHLVVVLALGRADGMRGDSSQDDVDELDIERAHQEAQQGAIHTASFALVCRVHLAKELVDKRLDSGLEDRLACTDNTHEDASADAGEVVGAEPVVERILKALVFCDLLVADVVTFYGGNVQDIVREAEVGQPSHDVGTDVQEVAVHEVFANFGGHALSRVDAPDVG